MLTMTPLRRGIISRATRCRQKNTPLAFTRMIRSQSASVRSMMYARRVTPALLTSTSMRSKAAITRRTMASMAATSPTSVSTARPRRPSCETASAVDLASPASMSTAATCAPARASARAAALPIPVPAPVTIATRSVSVMLIPPGVAEGQRIPYSSGRRCSVANRAVVVDPEAPGRLVIRSVPEPTPDRGEAIVRVRAISLNRGEVRRAGMAAAGWRPGWDLAGVVERAAADGSGPSVGARVVGFLPEGAWAQRVAVPKNALAVLPDKVTFSQAATFPVAGLTALLALSKAGPLLGKRVLVTGATGGVGDFAVQLARLGGAHVTASVRRADQVPAVRALGAHDVVVGDEIPRLPKHDLIIESVGGKTLGSALAALERAG